VLLVAASYAAYAFSPIHRPWSASDNDPADYRFVAEYFWGVPHAPSTYAPRWNGGWGAYLRTVPFRGIGLGTLYLLTGVIVLGHAPATEAEVLKAGVAFAAFEKLLLAVALLAVFETVRRRWGRAVAFLTLAVTAFPPLYWRMCDDFLAEPVERIAFLAAFACAVASSGKAAERMAWALVALFLLLSHVKVQWYAGAWLLMPAMLVSGVRSGHLGRGHALLIGGAILTIPLSLMAVNWIGWRTTALSPGIGIHVNLKYDGDVVREFSQTPAAQASQPAFTDPRRPKWNWWNIYVGGDVRREDYDALDRFARRYVVRHRAASMRAFGDGIALASTVPAVQRMEGGLIRLTPLKEPWSTIVRAADLVVWTLLLVGLWFDETRSACALALVLWIVPALGHVFSLYELRYHVPMAGIGAAAACCTAARMLRRRPGVRLLAPSTTVQ
jgi:hypothetical protein